MSNVCAGGNKSCPKHADCFKLSVCAGCLSSWLAVLSFVISSLLPRRPHRHTLYMFKIHQYVLHIFTHFYYNFLIELPHFLNRMPSNVLVYMLHSQHFKRDITHSLFLSSSSLYKHEVELFRVLIDMLVMVCTFR